MLKVAVRVTSHELPPGSVQMFHLTLIYESPTPVGAPVTQCVCWATLLLLSGLCCSLWPGRLLDLLSANLPVATRPRWTLFGLFSSLYIHVKLSSPPKPRLDECVHCGKQWCPVISNFLLVVSLFHPVAKVTSVCLNVIAKSGHSFPNLAIQRLCAFYWLTTTKSY